MRSAASDLGRPCLVLTVAGALRIIFPPPLDEVRDFRRDLSAGMRREPEGMFSDRCGPPWRLWLFALLLLVQHCAFALERASPAQHLDAGLQAFQRGALEEAVVSWTDAARSAQLAGNIADQITALEY